MEKSKTQKVLDEYRQAYSECTGGGVIRIRENCGWFYLIFHEFGSQITTNPYRLKQLARMTETLRERIDERKAEVLIEE